MADLVRASGRSVPELASKLGCSPHALYSRRRGRQRVPVDFLLRLAQEAGATVRLKLPPI